MTPAALKGVVGLLLAGHLAFSLAPAFVDVRQDFANYYVSARALAEGRALDRAYERAWFLDEARRQGVSGFPSFVPHPPANAALLLPVVGLGLVGAKAAWTAFLAASLGIAFLVLRRVLEADPWWLALAFLLPTAATRNALAYGQPYPLLLALLCLSLLAETRGRSLLAGVLLSPLVVLKLYGLPFLLGALATRRGRVALGLVTGTSVLVLGSIGLFGWPIHAAYLGEVLPPSVEGRIQDPYSPTWQSMASLAHRVLQREPDLNPVPFLESRPLLRVVLRAWPAVVLLVTLAGLRARREVPPDPARDWAILTLALLAASPLTVTYHFVLLILPAAVLMGRTPSLAGAGVLAALAFAASPLPHYFSRFASGPGTILAYPRLYCVLGLLLVALRPRWDGKRAAWAAAAGLALGLTALPAPREEAWNRVAGVGGYLAGEPKVCGGRLSWLAVEGGDLVRRGSDCPGDRALSPDGRWRLAESWRGGSWDVVAVEVASGRELVVTADPANEREPAWLSDHEVVFASDRRRGLGSTALYSVPFPRP